MKKCLLLLSCTVLTCGFTVPTQEDISGVLEQNVESFSESAISEDDRQQWDTLSELQKKFEDEVSHMLQVQDDFERNVVLEAQNLSTKKKLTKQERKNLLNSYRDMPKDEDEYKRMSRDIKRSERKVEKPKFPQDEKLVKIPDPRYVFVKYNVPPGSNNIDLRNLVTTRQVNSRAVISPNRDKMAYTTVYYVGYNDKVSSEVFYIDLDTSKAPKTRVLEASFLNKNQIKLLDSAVKEEYPSLFKTLTIVDWSQDGTKLVLKERVGSSTLGTWQTNVWVYDLSDKSTKQLVEVREAVKYWWQTNKNVNIDDYRWDIIPLGWDSVNPDRIMVCAYAYTNKKSTMFLGLYSVDAKGKNTQFVSEKPMKLDINANGLFLKPVFD